MANYIFTVKNFCSCPKQKRMELLDAGSAPALLEKLSYMFHPSIADRIISSEAVGKDRVLAERNYNYAMLVSHYRPNSAPIVHDRDILMVDFLYSDQEGCEDLRRLLESASVPDTLARNQSSATRTQYLQFWSEVHALLSEEFIAKFLNETRKHTLQGHGRDYLDIYNPPFDYFLHISNIVRLCLVHEDESKTRIDVPYEVAMGASCWSEESIMQTAHLEDDGNLSIRIYGDADIEERKLANEEEIEKRKPRHDEKYYMNSRIKFTDLKAPRTTLELLWMTERYFSEYGARLYADSSEADFEDATGYFNYVRDIFNIETIGELKQGERLI